MLLYAFTILEQNSVKNNIYCHCDTTVMVPLQYRGGH